MERREGVEIVPSVGDPYLEVVASAFLLARQIAQLNPAAFADRLRLLLRRPVTAHEVVSIEAGRLMPPSDYLLAAGKVSETSVSILLGELTYDEDRISQLEADFEALRVGLKADGRLNQ